MLKLIKPAALVVALAIAGGGLWWWWNQQAIYPSTNDAYVEANILSIAPEIGGKVTTVGVHENDHVDAGDVLFRIDTSTLQAAVDAAEAQLDMAIRSVDANNANLSAAEARLAAAKATFKNADDAFERASKLAQAGNLSDAGLEQARTARDQAEAQMNAAESARNAARDQLGKAGGNNAGIRAARAELDRAKIALSHAVVHAPASGWIANISLRPGQVVSPGQPLFSLIEDSDWWVSANFKETDLDRIKPGQNATIGIDMYPGMTVSGRVESIGAGAGAVFSLLPSENATGNWVKVTRRFPVRVALDMPTADAVHRLRVGASTLVTIDTLAQQKK